MPRRAAKIVPASIRLMPVTLDRTLLSHYSQSLSLARSTFLSAESRKKATHHYRNFLLDRLAVLSVHLIITPIPSLVCSPPPGALESVADSARAADESSQTISEGEVCNEEE